MHITRDALAPLREALDATPAAHVGALLTCSLDEARALDARLHEARNALHRVVSMHAAIRAGYRFDDADGPEMLRLIGDAAETLRSHLALLEQALPTARVATARAAEAG